jgi:homogentisate 1,2-dioxygenase
MGMDTDCYVGNFDLRINDVRIKVYDCTTFNGAACVAGRLRVTTEFGILEAAPGEIFVVQRGIRFSVALLDGPSRGYVLEVFGGHFQLPDLGPIGANGLANPRDFLAPVAWFDQSEKEFTVYHKLEGDLFESKQVWYLLRCRVPLLVGHDGRLCKKV